MSSAPSSVNSITDANQQRINYLNLLIAQMRNQNPLDPLDNNQMATQLAQISQLDQLESLNTSFRDVLSATRMSYAASLIGKTVTFLPEGQTTPITGRATSVEQLDGEPAVRVCTNVVKVSNLLSISE
jgi:flagellar basal-body rod modification protein FlgD